MEQLLIPEEKVGGRKASPRCHLSCVLKTGEHSPGYKEKPRGQARSAEGAARAKARGPARRRGRRGRCGGRGGRHEAGKATGLAGGVF